MSRLLILMVALAAYGSIAADALSTLGARRKGLRMGKSKKKRSCMTDGAAAMSGGTRYFLVQYSNQFCGAAYPANQQGLVCQEVYPDGCCHGMSAKVLVSSSYHVSPCGTCEYDTDSMGYDCQCNNGNVLDQQYSLCDLDHGGSCPQSTCVSGGGIGVRMIKGTWVTTGGTMEQETFRNWINTNCVTTTQDIAGSGSCQGPYNFFHHQDMKILKHVGKDDVEKEEKEKKMGVDSKGRPCEKPGNEDCFEKGYYKHDYVKDFAVSARAPALVVALLGSTAAFLRSF